MNAHSYHVNIILSIKLKVLMSIKVDVLDYQFKINPLVIIPGVQNFHFKVAIISIVPITYIPICSSTIREFEILIPRLMFD